MSKLRSIHENIINRGKSVELREAPDMLPAVPEVDPEHVGYFCIYLKCYRKIALLNNKIDHEQIAKYH